MKQLKYTIIPDNRKDYSGKFKKINIYIRLMIVHIAHAISGVGSHHSEIHILS